MQRFYKTQSSLTLVMKRSVAGVASSDGLRVVRIDTILTALFIIQTDLA